MPHRVLSDKPCPLCGRNTKVWPLGSNNRWESNSVELSWPGVVDAGRDMSNDGTVDLLLSPEPKQPTFPLHMHCLWVLCRGGSISYMEAYRLCRGLQQEKNDEPDFDGMIDPLHLFDSPDPFDHRNYRMILDPKKYGVVFNDAPVKAYPSFLGRLPIELLHGIFEHLPFYSLMACSFVSRYIKAAVSRFCAGDPLMKLVITRFAGERAIPDGWELLRQQFTSNRNQTMDMIDNFGQFIDNTRSLQRIQITERTPYDARLQLYDLEQPVTFFTQRVRHRRYVCGIRLNDGRVFGVETNEEHRTNTAISEESPLRLFFDSLGIHGIGIGSYRWKDAASQPSWAYCWRLDAECHAPCVFDGCKLRVRSTKAGIANGTPETDTPAPMLLEEGFSASAPASQDSSPDLYFRAAQVLPLPTDGGRVTVYVSQPHGRAVGIESISKRGRHLIGNSTGYPLQLPLGTKEIVQKIDFGLPRAMPDYPLNFKFYTNYKEVNMAPYLPSEDVNVDNISFSGFDDGRAITGLYARRDRAGEHFISAGIAKTDSEIPFIPREPGSSFKKTMPPPPTTEITGVEATFRHFAKLGSLDAVAWHLEHESGRCIGLELFHQEGYSDTLGRLQTDERIPFTAHLQEAAEQIRSVEVIQDDTSWRVNAIYVQTGKGRRLGPVQKVGGESVVFDTDEYSALTWSHNEHLDLVQQYNCRRI